VARVLIVGCGCRGRELSIELTTRGHAVRGTTRDPGRCDDIAAAGAEPVVADPDRLSTLVPHIDGVSVLCWLMGSAQGDDDAIDALHGPRLRSMAEKLVDSGVRGLVYEAAGSVDPGRLEAGRRLVGEVAETWRMPTEIVDHDPADHEGWVTAFADAVDRVLLA
jgi:uncharacterized protein YbjT (DUF2867 family)